MQNVHTHAWDPEKHIAAATRAEADRSRGGPMDLTTPFERFMVDAEPFSRVAVFGLKAHLNGYWVPDQYVADFVKRAPEKLVGFACSDPTQDGSLDELKVAHHELGMVGVKMAPMYAGFDPRDPRCLPIYAYCQEHGLPILFHSGTTFNAAAPLAFTRPWLFDEVAIRYPELRMILAHVGHPYGDECLVVIRKHPHVYADISALFYRPWQFYNMLIIAQEYHVTHKLIFGTDYPFAGSIESINGLRNANHIIGASGLPRVTDDTIQGILHRDAFALLGIKPMKIVDVEAIVLDTGKDYPDPSLAKEAHGVRFVSLVRITTDAGIVGWSDVETQPHVGKSIMDAPSGGLIGFESLRAALLGENPLERERLWQKMYRYLAYYGRDGAGMQMISGVDIALWDIAGKAFQQPVSTLLGARYRNKVKAYASTLFRSTPEAMKEAVASYTAHGFKAIKFGWGAFGHDLRLDIALVQAAREAAGSEIDLMVDGGWYGTGYSNPYRPRPLRDWITLVQELEALKRHLAGRLPAPGEHSRLRGGCGPNQIAASGGR